MLERLYIKNIALIEEADIRFDGKFNVLSGETGSGKSVILDSINFVLGSKADKSMIRYGEDEALVKAEFILPEDSAVNAVLSEMDIDPDETLIISRKFSADGKNSIKINGNTVTAGMLKTVAAHLVDVHGQSEHFFLLNENNQLSVIDALCGSEALEIKNKLKQLFSERADLFARTEALGGSERERAQKLDLLSFQIKEIKQSDIKVGEFEKLTEKKKYIDNSEKILTALNTISAILSGDEGCTDHLSYACKQSAAISDIGEDYSNLYERLEELSSEMQDVSETVSDLADSMSFDGEEAQEVEARLDLLKSLFKKYGADENEVLSYLQQAEKQYEDLSDAAAELEKIAAKIEKINAEIYKNCLDLTQIRKKTAKKLCKEVEEQLKSLNISNAQFYVDFTEYSKEEISSAWSNGADKICFMFSANKGEPPKRLSKVISGGEMSRFMLAIKTQMRDINGISTYIFDEIDAGISGVTAKSVAEKFISISKNTQIIAVSHLPQVCAAASSQFLISKSSSGDKTVTRIEHLDRKRRIQEIVRLTGSISTDAAAMHAEELLEQFGN